MKYYILVLFFLSACSAKGQKNMNTILEIDFQDFFKNDTVSLEIGHQSVVKNVIVNSDFSTGLTELRLKVFLNEDQWMVQFGTKSVEINKVAGQIEINVLLNGYLNNYNIDLEHGKYIGINKKSNSNKLFDFYQAKEPFVYD